MNRIVLENLRAVLPDDVLPGAAVVVENGRIQTVGRERESGGRTIDLGGATLFPGFIDIHNHGAVGIDVNEADADGLRKIGAFLAGRGVTSWLPTFVPDSDETYRRVIAGIEEVVAGQDGRAEARIVGVHYEGIFANTQMCGALRPGYFKTFTGSELDSVPRLRKGAHMTTFAPEIDGGVALAAALTEAGWVASIGHTRADPSTLDAARAAGAKHLTHFFNAMTGLHHRDVGVVGWALGRDVTIDIIADGIHVHPDVLKVVIRSKGIDAVSLISDSVAPTGLGDGEFGLWGERISVAAGRTRNERGSIAGSVITMADAVRTVRSIGFSAPEIARMASLNPARLLGIEGECGSIEPGKRADLVAVNDAGEVVFMMVGGRW